MSGGESMYGTCGVCGKEGPLRRTYFHYDIKCECHSPSHFVIIDHCPACVPKNPEEIKVTFRAKPYFVNREMR